jgi:hypothetical protein
MLCQQCIAIASVDKQFCERPGPTLICTIENDVPYLRLRILTKVGNKLPIRHKEFISTFVKYRYLEKAAKVVISNK